MISEIAIKCFLTAAENGSFTKTAEKLYMTRQAVSKQIAQLEKEVGVRLFDRTTAKVEPTAAGRLFVTFFTGMLKEWEKTCYLAKAMDHRQSNLVRVGSPYDMDLGKQVFEAIGRCRQSGMDLSLEWEHHEAAELVQMLTEGRLDVIISFGRSIEEIDQAKPVVEIQLFCMVSAMLTVSSKNEYYSPGAQVTDYQNAPCFIAKEMVENPPGVNGFKHEWKRYGLNLQDVRLVPNRESMKTMVEIGSGFTICTDLDALTRMPGIVTYPLNRKLELYTIWRKEESSTPVLAFLDELNAFSITG